MKKFRAQTMMVAITALAMATATSAGIVKTVDSLTIIDADGRLVGHVDEGPGDRGSHASLIYPGVYFEIDERLVLLYVDADGFLASNLEPHLYYLDDSCGGTAYVLGGNAAGLFDLGIISTPGQTLYLAPPTRGQSRSFKSLRFRDGRCQADTFPVGLWSREAAAVVDLTEEFTMPLRMVPGCRISCAQTVKLSTDSETSVTGER